MKLPKVGCAAVGLLAAVVILWQVLDVRTCVLLSRPSGSITAGSLMGVSVGDEANHAVERLRALGFGPSVFYPGGGDLYSGGLMEDPNHPGGYIHILPAQTIIALEDDSWRNGGVELLVQDGRIIRITWGYGGPFMAMIW